MRSLRIFSYEKHNVCKDDWRQCAVKYIYSKYEDMIFYIGFRRNNLLMGAQHDVRNSEYFSEVDDTLLEGLLKECNIKFGGSNAISYNELCVQ